MGGGDNSYKKHFYPILKEQIMQTLLDTSKEMHILTPNSFYEANKIKHMKRKENYSSFHSQYRRKKLQTEILSNQIQQNI